MIEILLRIVVPILLGAILTFPMWILPHTPALIVIFYIMVVSVACVRLGDIWGDRYRKRRESRENRDDQ